MFKLFSKKEQKDPICGMSVNENSISKYGAKFCSENCVKQFEVQNQIADSNNENKKGGGCCS